ncbi:NAD(P)/FAD-dependent oxidoreductase [Leptolyngbya sp. FACHB-261]|uniref:flavin monoamine oxidase family protein n=1 Tax=Leptolyngbya sp. FACHB-261 TaxID=2692806 RepID=UPI001684C033|nr:NAD(P)/FAD-dependent oxidoreductase [Leptolyngbya sp. FACHB-261]MBD2101802.1 FAD-dependent oxidoreductase [Leptolyngbya sp. FACHB-261]
MSHTPVFDYLRRVASAQTQPFQPSRRRFLQTGLAAAVVPLVPVSKLKPPQVVIVGCGIAGLTAGYRLKQRGVQVALYEASNRLGGRTFSLRNHFPEGQVAELGGEYIDSHHNSIRVLATELGLELYDVLAEDRGLTDNVWYLDGQLLTNPQVLTAFAPIRAQIQQDLQGSAFTQNSPGIDRLDQLSITEWLDGVEAEPFIKKLLNVAYTVEYGVDASDQSALNLLYLLGSGSPVTGADQFALHGVSDERYRIRGGNDRLALTLASKLVNEIHTGTALEAVRQRADGYLTCSFWQDNRSFEVAAPQVILALPFTMLRQVKLAIDLPPRQRRAIAELGYGTNAKLMVGFNERLWRSRYNSNGSVHSDLDFQSTWETSRGQPGPAGILTNFTGGGHGVALSFKTPAWQEQQFLTQLEQIFPGVGAARSELPVARFQWPTYPHTRGSYSCYRVGQWMSFAGSEGQSVGNLHFAGEHCSVVAQGFMEGACESGERVARMALALVPFAERLA